MFESVNTLVCVLFRHQRIDWVHIPRKDKKGGSNGETGFPSNSEPIYTFGDLIRSMKEMFNADYRIKDGIFYFNEKTVFIFRHLIKCRIILTTKKGSWTM
jgi:hypothetical protein